ncbi:MAG: DUF1566 domain-containing protein [Pseudomonadota bacterium]
MGRQNGNALFLILIGVALFAALSYAVTQSSRGGGDIEREKRMIDQAASKECNITVKRAVKKLKLFGGCDTSEISYELADGTNPNPDAPADKSCHVFDPAGAGAVACGAYLDLDCDLEALAIGEKCLNADIIYAGDLAGARLYTTAADQGLISWNKGNVNYADTGATSTTDGKANTDTLVTLDSIGAPYKAAEACRALGSEWYMPAQDELEVLYTNRAAIGGFNTSGDFPASYYWSSTQQNDDYTDARFLKFTSGYQHHRGKSGALPVRCVRR